MPEQVPVPPVDVIRPLTQEMNQIIESAAITNAQRAELIAQGFPDYMIYSFLETAKATKSIVLSRVPGGVGTDLIKEGYDLKGFHIKAKSCNWGPMAGFICQVPLLNKDGFNKMSFNTGEIAHYLERLKAFSNSRVEIDRLNVFRNEELSSITLLPADQYKSKINKINELYNSKIRDILLKSRSAEQSSGAWTGENTLEDPLPFISLKRKIPGGLEEVKTMRGVIPESCTELSDGKIFGRAQNITDEDVPANNKPTVTMDFLLVNDTTDSSLWSIYHGNIMYKVSPDDEEYTKYFDSTSCQNDLTEAIIKDYREFIDIIFNIPEPDFVITNTGDEAKIIESGGLKRVKVKRDFFSFYRVKGIMNPFPPFPKKTKDSNTDNPNYYKNAVSGDYDLFAIWPHTDVHTDDLIRQSEFSVGKKMRMGGKIFTTWLGNKGNFGIEFIPGFKELNPANENDILKESADFGNMNSLCHLVSGYLNSFAASFISQFGGISSNANKGFHSDEGGRPGVIEIEYPVAVFFPKVIKSRALNNVKGLGKIPAISTRTEIETSGGLIKSSEDLVGLIVECMDQDYRVLMHYGWMIHLLYLTTLPDKDRVAYIAILKDIKFKAAINETLGTVVTSGGRKIIFNYDFDNQENLNKLFKDFDKIDINTAIINEKIECELLEYLKNLKKILTADNDKESFEFFTALRDQILSYAFQGKKPSFTKRQEVEKIMITNAPILPQIKK